MKTSQKRRATTSPSFSLERWLDWGMGNLARYLRLELEGIDRIPKHGPAILIANHSGFAGLDALMLAHVVRRKTGRHLRIVAHRGFFDWSSSLRELSFGMNLREPHVSTAAQTLEHGHLLLVFPEGESGNFKSSFRRYRLRPFHSGFLRLSHQTGAPILPCLVIGAEETHLNLGSIDLGRWSPHLRIPLPLNLLPLPARWKIKVMAPISAGQEARLRGRQESIRLQMQRALQRELAKRGNPFLGRASRL